MIGRDDGLPWALGISDAGGTPAIRGVREMSDKGRVKAQGAALSGVRHVCPNARLA